MPAALPSWFGGLATDLGLIAGALLAIGVIWRTVIRPVLRYARRVESTIQAVQGQLVNNGGTTLRDAVDRIDLRTSTLEAWRESVDLRLPPAPTPKPKPRKRTP